MKRLKFLIALAVLSGGYWSYNHKEGKEQNDTLMLQNIEALAEGEYPVDYFCYGSGSVRCPDGTDVKYYIDNYRLE